MKLTRFILSSIIFLGCQQEMIAPGVALEPSGGAQQAAISETTSLSCNAQAEQVDYNIFRMNTDGARVGDVMPYYDAATASFYIYYLKDIWNDATHERHPWHGFKTKDFYSYAQLSAGEIISCSSNGCDQDYALGTGGIIKKNSTFYAFYTGHNPNYPSACVMKREGIMLATSNGLNKPFKKSQSFTTIYPPTGEGFDEQDNFRDPFIIFDGGIYYMIVSARKNVNGTWKGVLAKFTSGDLINWSYDGILYDGAADNFFMLETAEIFKMGSTYYLLFSDIDSKHVYYRKSTSLNGPWNKPVGQDRFDGKGIYAAKTATDGVDRYIFGWTNILTGHTDSGSWGWGGNLVVHKLYQKSNGDLAVTIPHSQQSHLNTVTHSLVKNSQWGNVVNTKEETHSYRLISPASFDVANVIFEPIDVARYKIKCNVSYANASKDFGFMIGACDGYENFFSLRFVPSQSRFSLDKINRSLITATTVATTDVPFSFNPNTTIQVEIVVENSMLVVYINNEVALSTRIYKASNTSWGVFADHSDVTFTDIIVSRP